MPQTVDKESTIYTDLVKAVASDNIEEFLPLFRELHPYDQAQFFFSQQQDLRMKMYTFVSPEEMAELFENVDVEDQETYITEMEPNYAADMLAKMYADDAVDVLNELDADQIASYLALMEDEASREIRELLHYEEETAGSIMTTEFVVIRQFQTAAEAMQILKQEAPGAETIYYIFVIDEQKRLSGVMSLRNLIIADETTLIQDIMDERVVSVSVGADQEKAAKLMKDYDLLALPVIDFQKHLLGIITVDDIVDVIDEEASEDYSKLAAVSDVDLTRNPLVAVKKRLPWLVILLFLGMLTATLISQFEATLEQVAILAAFIPVVAGTTGNSGTQSLAVVVRGLATGDFDNLPLKRHFLQEMVTALVTGAVCGIVITGIIFLWKEQLFIGLVAGFSLMLSIFIGTLAGSLVPLIMHRLKVDPAVASGPFITTICDIISMSIYFSIATLFMGYLA